MANINTVEYAAQLAAASNGAAMADGNAVSTPVMFARCRRTLTGTEAAADVLRIVELGPGDTVIPALCSVFCQDPGTVFTAIVGLSTDTDAYSSLMTMDAGGLFRFTPTVTPAEFIVPTIVQAVLGTVTTPTAGAVVDFCIAYVKRQ